MKMYIISWFGEGEIREYRKERHNKQVAWAIEKGLQPVVCAMEYEKEDYLDAVQYHIIERNPPAFARNILLQDFYQSDDDYCIIADNDAVFREISEFDFLSKFNERYVGLIEQKVGLFTPLNPIRLPFNKVYNERKTYYDSNLVFEKNTHTKGSLYFCLNFKKHTGKELYFDSKFEQFNGDQIIPYEDVEFGFACMAKGWNTCYSRNIVLVEYSPTKSTWAKDNGDRSDDIGLQHIAEKYSFQNTLNEGKFRIQPSKTAFVKNLPREHTIPLTKTQTIEEFF